MPTTLVMSDPTTALATRRVFDEEADDFAIVTAEMTERARLVRQAWDFTKHAQAACIREVYDQKLYLAAGYSTRAEYCELELGITARTARNLYSVAETFDITLDGLVGGGSVLSDRKPVSALPAAEDDENRKPVSDSDHPFASIAISKLYELSRLSADEIEEIRTTRQFTDAEGNAYTLDELSRLSKRQISAAVKAKLAPYKERLDETAAERDLLRAERDALAEAREQDAKERADLERRVAEAEALERQYGAPASLYADKMRRLTDARGHLDALMTEATRIGIDADDPEQGQDALAELLSRMESYHTRLRRQYALVLLEHANRFTGVDIAPLDDEAA